MMNRTFRITAAAFALAAAPLAGCDLFEVDDQPNPNGISLEDIIDNPTAAVIQNLAVGTESSSRVRLETYLTSVGVIGREYYRISASDPRFTADLLGKGDAELNNNTFYLTAPWGTRYATIRNANTMLQALSLNETLSGEEKAGYRGFANTWKAYQYLLNLNLTYTNGLRFIEPGEDFAGPVVPYDESLDRIATLLDEAAADLDGGVLLVETTTYTGPQDADLIPEPNERMYRLNRALASRVDLYREDWAGAASAIEEGGFFLDEDNLEAGAYHIFGQGPGDATNLFAIPFDANGDLVAAHPSFTEDIQDGDERINKIRERESVTFDGLTSEFGVDVYPTALTPIPIVTNGELYLNRAEARIQGDDTDGAIDDLNVVRNAAGLDDYDGDTDDDALIEELLYQRRYQLYAEGQRWVDARRYGILDQLPIDREGDDVFERFPIPENENAEGLGG
jgi:hypothetical protein